MKIVCIGGGPAGLYFSILMKKAFPEVRIDVYERNKPDDTFGWGVVFSDETLDNFEEADPESYRTIRDSFAYWSDIETYYADTCVRSTGHGFCGLARKRLLQIFHERCRELGIRIEFESEVVDENDVGPADLVIAADGINSFLRSKYADTFQPDIDNRLCKFAWFGTRLPLEAFTFIFRENQHGLFQVHAYPFQRGKEPLSTWIVECREEVWRSAGLDKASEEETVAYVTELFADHLDGHALLVNRSLWRTFPTIKCKTWHKDNVCLMGDSAHTAHFSIGSGTKLAMEDAIALVDAFRQTGLGDVPKALERYEDERWVDVIKLQKAAQTSLEWFENSARYMGQAPIQLQFNLMTRSKRITYDNLRLRDPELVRRVDDWFAKENGVDRDSSGKSPAPMFAPFKLRSLKLENRVVVSPMCQYTAAEGLVHDWHLVHLASRAIGGAGLVFTEMTNISAEGRITHGCAGVYTDEHESSWKRIVDFCHGNSRARLAIQLGHAGRKAACHLPWEGDDPLRDGTAWRAMGPSPLPFDDDWPTPREMDRGDMERILAEYVQAAERSERAGFDMLEIHMAHGYLLSSFLSPVSNMRGDEYGGTLENRLRFPLEVYEAVRRVWPAEKPMSVRISASDWLGEKGMTIADSVHVARVLRDAGLDLIDVSSAGNTPLSQPEYGRMYQVPFAERIRSEVGMAVMAVGAIQGADHVNTLIASGRADLCAIARGHLSDPYLTLRATGEYDHFDHPWPKQYELAQPRPRLEGRRR